MCGRYRLQLASGEWQDVFPFEFSDTRLNTGGAIARFNVSPTQVMPILRKSESGYELVDARWGLLPIWAQDLKEGYRMINARSETARTSNAFRSAFRGGRALVVARGFYEWERQGMQKVPYTFGLKDDELFAFAGLTTRWREPGSADDVPWINTFTILTGPPNPLVGKIHDRMPVILPKARYEDWLNEPEPVRAQELLQPYPAELMEARQVSSLVNSPRNDTPEILRDPGVPLTVKKLS